MNEEIKNLTEVAQRIKKAIENKENIVVVADSDLDGICSLILLKEGILSLGGNIIDFYFPDREKEGYGLSLKALEKIKKYIPALLITLDFGISSFEEIKKAKEMGFEVIVIDHHEVLDKLPEADLILNPKQKDDKYYFKHFSNTGLVFKLLEKILEDKMGEALRKNFLELVALATLTDMMPQEKENKILTDEGLLSMKESWRPGFLAIKEFFNIPYEISKVISILGVRYSQSEVKEIFKLFTTPSKEKAKEIFQKLIKKHQERREKLKEAIKKIEENSDLTEEVIFIGSEDFDYSLISSIASYLAKNYQKPVFVYKINEKEGVGSARAPKEFNLVELMKKCQEFLIYFGGHPQAAGFRFLKENLENFKACLISNIKNKNK
jgi:single-stranded-DNA-specific exonuclease